MQPVILHPCSTKISGSVNFNGDSYCATCNKKIYNFSQLNTEQLLQVISNSSSIVCGKVDASQVMISDGVDVSNFKRHITWKSIVATLAAAIISTTTFAQKGKILTNENPNYKITTTTTSEKDSFITISGIVLDSSTNKPLDYVAVILKNKNEAIINSVYTFEDGSFNFKIPKKSVSTASLLEIKNFPYKTITIDLSKNGNANLFLEIKLPKKFLSGVTKIHIMSGVIAQPPIIETSKPSTSHKLHSSEIQNMPR